MLTPEQIETFVRDGLLVVDGFLAPEELDQAHQGLAATLARYGVDVENPATTGSNLASLSSTNGSGGVLDIFYEEWQLKIALNAQLFAWTEQLWEAAYCRHGERLEDLDESSKFKWHPYGAFNDTNDRGYAYIDRICYRLPTTWSNEIGRQIRATRKAKKRGLQRSLTPHLDCCPDTFDDPPNNYNKSKWRPIQCFVSLTDNVEPNYGGFEAAKGFHREFRSWAQNRQPTQFQDKENGCLVEVPPPCIGEYTHIRPNEDADVMQRVEHIPVRAGSVVFWDNRLPHANAYRHDGSMPRSVIYCSFLPPVSLNREYAKRQLRQWLEGKTPNDQWIHNNNTHDIAAPVTTAENPKLSAYLESLPKLARCLLAVEDW